MNLELEDDEGDKRVDDDTPKMSSTLFGNESVDATETKDNATNSMSELLDKQEKSSHSDQDDAYQTIL